MLRCAQFQKAWGDCNESDFSVTNISLSAWAKSPYSFIEPFSRSLKASLPGINPPQRPQNRRSLGAPEMPGLPPARLKPCPFKAHASTTVAKIIDLNPAPVFMRSSMGFPKRDSRKEISRARVICELALCYHRAPIKKNFRPRWQDE